MIKGISHIGFDVKNMEAMLDFYCNALGMKKKFSMTFSQALRKMQSEPQAEMNEELTGFMQYLGQMGDKEWFVYLEMAPNQLIELFYQYGEKRNCQISNSIMDISILVLRLIIFMNCGTEYASME
ncbi:VOC family protein [Faecalicatena orotica]|uniref:VOC family protein n=1 Tax=Faecalicatena orotica TaxID=1544 RepID=UPI003217A02A